MSIEDRNLGHKLMVLCVNQGVQQIVMMSILSVSVWLIFWQKYMHMYLDIDGYKSCT